MTRSTSRLLLIFHCAVACLIVDPTEARAKFPTVSYDRDAGALLDALPQGKPFLIEGTVFSHERRVEVFYRLRGDKDCTTGPPLVATCPAGEKDGPWACRSWERTSGPPAKKSGKFTVLIPRLLHSLSPYCVRVAFYRMLSLERSTALADSLVLSLDRTLQERSDPTSRQLTGSERRRVIDEFFAEEELQKRVSPTAKKGATLKQANLAKLKEDLGGRVGTLWVARDMLTRLRDRFDAAVKKLLDPAAMQAMQSYISSVEGSADAEIKKLLGRKLKPKVTLLKAVQAYRDGLVQHQTAPQLERWLRADDGASLRVTVLAQLCHGIKAIRAKTPDGDVKACGDELARHPQAVLRAWRGLKAAAENKEHVYKSIVETVQQHLTDRIFTETALQDPAMVSRSKFVEYYFSTDIGVAAAFVPSVDGTETVAIPYLAVHFYLGPYNTNVPLRLEDSLLRRFTFFFGINISGFEIRSDQLAADGLFGNVVMMTGAGLRLTDFIRLNGGVMLYRYKDQNPLFQDQPGALGATGFASVSLVLDVYKWAATALRSP